MEEEIITKAIKITRKDKVPLVSTKDVITKNFPKAKVILSNVWGEMVVTEVELEVKTPAQYNSMPYFYKHLLPLLIPLQEENNTNSEEKKDDAILAFGAIGDKTTDELIIEKIKKHEDFKEKYGIKSTQKEDSAHIGIHPDTYRKYSRELAKKPIIETDIIITRDSTAVSPKKEKVAPLS